VVKIYTKKGDRGQTALFGGPAVSKADARLEAYGTLDELNSVLGLARADLAGAKVLADLDADLARVQNYIFTLGSHLAVGDESMRTHLPPLDPAQVPFLENRIDAMEAKLPPLKNFILPGGGRAAAGLHLARTVARRGERAVVRLNAAGTETAPDPHIVIFLNRLSDYFFVAARFANAATGVSDVLWNKNPSP
jgi:cob(I)alamin adenosyltransferase